MYQARIEISLKQLRKNIHALQKIANKALYCLPVKANAYGHGLCKIGKEAEQAGVHYLAVAHVHEGICLRDAGIRIPIIVFGVVDEDVVDLCIEYNLEFSILSLDQAKNIQKQIANKQCSVHLKVETGMHRMGVNPDEAKALYVYLEKQKCFRVVGIYSHLATADKANDPFAETQISIFRELMSDPIFAQKNLIFHLCNSGGTLFFPEAHFDMVRPGLATYGYLPVGQEIEGIEPCFSLIAKVSFSKEVQSGSGVSYGHTYRTSRNSRIVTIPVGYGDGFLRSLSNTGIVLLKGQRFPIVGNICMDQFMVDVGQKQIHFKDEAVLIGKQGSEEISVAEIAELSGTIPYEILCLLNERIPRIYVD